MKLYFVEKVSEGDTDLQLAAMREHFTFTELKDADAIYCANIIHTHKALSAKATRPEIPLIVYCWDYYKWAHDGKHPGDGNWTLYAKMLKEADMVIVPSNAQRLRLKELLGVNSVVVRSGIRKFDQEAIDGGYILDPLRTYPDETSKWAYLAAEELGIPLIHSEHSYSEEDWQKLVAGCSFMTCSVSEASTGALTLAEGLYLGKVSLVSNSPYNGAKDYLSHFGHYFQHDSYESLKDYMWYLWQRRPLTVDAKEYVEQVLSYKSMAFGIYQAITLAFTE